MVAPPIRAAGRKVFIVSASPEGVVRRMVLKRVVYGVDKNPMAVELAKVALWLHSFTVGAPLTRVDYERRWAGLKAHNRWLVDFCAEVPGRRAGVAQVFLNHVEDTVAEIRWMKEAERIYPSLGEEADEILRIDTLAAIHRYGLGTTATIPLSLKSLRIITDFGVKDFCKIFVCWLALALVLAR